MKQAKLYLSQYYDFYETTWQKNIPLALEYNFGFHNVHFDSIPINGKIDKIEFLDRAARQVKIIDYKTSSPKSLNYLAGKTQENDTAYLYQAYFYKLLAENDPLFEWKIKEVEFEFLTPENGKFKKIIIPIEKKEFAQFQDLVKGVYKNIIDLKFESNVNACKKLRGDCDYVEFCHET
jgi:DNA helicase-2/ATP-dependent DNA helicase PcrA